MAVDARRTDPARGSARHPKRDGGWAAARLSCHLVTGSWQTQGRVQGDAGLSLGRGQKSGLFGAGSEVRGGLGLLPRSCGQPAGPESESPGLWDPRDPCPASGPGTSPADALVPRGSPWNSPSQVPTFQGRTWESGQGAMWGSGSQQARPAAAPVWSDPEASSLACLRASVPRQGVPSPTFACCAHLPGQGCCSQPSSRAPGAKVGATWNFPQPIPLMVPGVPSAGSVRLCPAFPRRGLGWQEKGHE